MTPDDCRACQQRQHDFEIFLRESVATLRAQMTQVLTQSVELKAVLADHEKRISLNESWGDKLRGIEKQIHEVETRIEHLSDEVRLLREQRAGLLMGSRVLVAALTVLATIAGWGISIWTGRQHQ